MFTMLSLYSSYYNLGNYLRWFTRSVPNEKLHELGISAGKRKEIDNCYDDQITAHHESGGRWQSPPQDVMEGILQKMGLIARTRLAKVCMSWRSLTTRADLRSAPQLPWLVHPQTLNTNYLTFSSLSEGEVVNLELPNPKRLGGHRKFKLQASSKGWLIISQEKGLLNLDMFLYNPISGAQYQLPSLNTVPSFPSFRTAEMLSKWNGFSNRTENFVTKIVLSSPNISECIVAAVFHPQKKLGLCRPGDKSWTVIDILNHEDDYLMDLLFTRGMLYGLVDKVINHTNNSIGAARSLNFGDDQAIKVDLKLVYVSKEDGDTTEHHGDHQIQLNGDYNSYLLESTTNRDKEILLIYQMFDCLRTSDDDDDIYYQRTRGFLVYKIDLESGNFHEIRNLGDQIIFLAEHNSSMSVPASDFKLQGNCIYFATSGYDPITNNKTPIVIRNISREIGIFSLDDGKVKRPFPSLDVGIPSTSKQCWFSPSL